MSKDLNKFRENEIGMVNGRRNDMFFILIVREKRLGAVVGRFGSPTLMMEKTTRVLILWFLFS